MDREQFGDLVVDAADRIARSKRLEQWTLYLVLACALYFLPAIICVLTR